MAEQKYNFVIGRKYQADILFQIEGESYLHSIRSYGLFLLDQTNIYTPTPKSVETVSYIELDGEEVGKVSIDGDNIAYEPFDYEIELAYSGDKLFTSQNYFIAAMEYSFKEGKEITLINTYTGIKLLARYVNCEVTETGRAKYGNVKDFTIIKVVFRVSKPTKCDFNLQDFTETLTDGGEGVYITSVDNLYPYIDAKVKSE